MVILVQQDLEDLKAQRAIKAIRAIRANVEKTATLDGPVIREKKVTTAKTEKKEILENKVLPENLVPWVLWVLVVPRENKDQ
jgi:hypothetical protein